MRTIDEILDTLAERHKLKNDSAIAKLLGVGHSTLSAWKSRQTIPYNVLLHYCVDNQFDMVELLTGIPVTKQSIAATKTKVVAENKLQYTPVSDVPDEIQPIFEAFMEVMTSEDKDAQDSLTRNVFTFQRTVRNEKKIAVLEKKIAELEKDMEVIKRRLLQDETDFKTQEQKRGE